MAKVTTYSHSPGIEILHRRAAPKALLRLAALLVAVLTVGCGNKGDLYLESTRAAVVEQTEAIDEVLDGSGTAITDEDDESEDEDESKDKDLQEIQ